MKCAALAMMRVALPSLVAAAASAMAQQAPSTQYACYVPGSGTVYRIKEANTPAQCSAGHVEFQMAASSKPSSGPTGPAGGDLGGTYPNPIVANLQGQPVLNAAGAFDFSNANGLVSVGTPGVGSIPASGPGTRLMWVPTKGALRAGSAENGEWDLANIGDGSIALGMWPRASGTASVALGKANKATGDRSLALGSGSLASGVLSVSIGGLTQATGQAATAIGNGANAFADNSTAIGHTATASASNATAIGHVVEASGTNSVALGFSVFATGNNSMALGQAASTNGMVGAFVYGDRIVYRERERCRRQSVCRSRTALLAWRRQPRVRDLRPPDRDEHWCLSHDRRRVDQ